MTGDLPEARGRHAASATLSAARGRADPGRAPLASFPRVRRRLAPEIRAEIGERFGKQEFCTYCGGLHAGISLPACPRVASFELNADGALISAAFWPSGSWDASEVFFSSDADTDDEPA